MLKTVAFCSILMATTAFGDVATYAPSTLDGKITVNECDFQEFNTHKKLGKWISLHLEGEISQLTTDISPRTNIAKAGEIETKGYLDIKRRTIQTKEGYVVTNICNKEDVYGNKVKMISSRTLSPQLGTVSIEKTVIFNADYKNKKVITCENSDIPGVINFNYSVSEPFSRIEKFNCSNGDEITELVNFNIITQNEAEIILHSSDTNQNSLNAVVTVSKDRKITGFRTKYFAPTIQYRSRYDITDKK